ncbi:hypothetical protein KOW79_022637 [Hemibagrus wyckioides]|uniref:Uncharacterized protein n=1 Tax=Hemibagrus wyckioides TaxID=337641 RepID=A0A9D3N0A7_9TELE|nr:hypothetical protein KOW79_022637 [Hemibagrus wyckioides]
MLMTSQNKRKGRSSSLHFIDSPRLDLHLLLNHETKLGVSKQNLRATMTGQEVDDEADDDDDTMHCVNREA